MVITAAGAGPAPSHAKGKIMGGMDFLIEDKLDGERMVLHKKGDEVMIFSRRTNRYAEYAECLAPLIRSQVCVETLIGVVNGWPNSAMSKLAFFWALAQRIKILIAILRQLIHGAALKILSCSSSRCLLSWTDCGG